MERYKDSDHAFPCWYVVCLDVYLAFCVFLHFVFCVTIRV